MARMIEPRRRGPSAWKGAAAAGVFAACAALLGPAAAAGDAHAQDSFPSRPLRLVVPSSPGGGTDYLARQLAEELGQALGQSVVVENRPGANGVIASESVWRAPADGYTLLIIQSSHTVNPATMKKLPYDTTKDFAGVGRLAVSPLILVAAAKSGVRNVADLRAFASANPERVSFAGSEMSTRLGSEQLIAALGVKGAVAMYKGTAPAIADLAGGHIPFGIVSIAAAKPFFERGQLNLLGLTSAARSPLMPQAPTLTEQGLAMDFSGWWGLVVTGNTPRDIVEKLGAEVRKVLANPKFDAKLERFAMTSAPSTPREFDAYIASDMAAWAAVVKAAKIEPE